MEPTGFGYPDGGWWWHERKGAKNESKVYGLRNWKDGVSPSRDDEEGSGRSLSARRQVALGNTA